MVTIRDVQRVMGHYGYYNNKAIDNDLGPVTLAACEKVLSFPAFKWKRLPSKRMAVAALQSLLYTNDFEEVGTVDGHTGMLTENGLSTFDYFLINGKKPDVTTRPDITAPQSFTTPSGPSQHWPVSADMEKFYGKAGGSQCTAGVVNLPYPMVLAWDKSTTIHSFRCHEKVADSAQRVYDRVHNHYPAAHIQEFGLHLFGGCYNYRKMRGGSRLSNHAYGVAIDTNPERNQLNWGRERASFALPPLDAWWSFWEEEGWTSLGRRFDFDYMHVEAVSY